MYLLDIIDRKLGVSAGTATAYVRDDFPASFPYDRWQWQVRQYDNYWNWFLGTVWEETIDGAQDKSGNPVYKYPLRINMIMTTCMKHNYVLFGEQVDGPNPLVPCKVKPDESDDPEDPPDEDDVKRSKQLTRVVNAVWMDNEGRTLQLENGLVQSFLGGCVFKVTYDPLDKDLKYGIKLEMVLPDFYMPVWDSTNPDRLLEAFLVWRITAREAYLKYGIGARPSSADGTSSEQTPQYVLYIEHWLENTVTILVGGKPLERTVEEHDADGNIIDTVTQVFENYPHDYGEIPLYYIPRERVGNYYGLSVIPNLTGLAVEINARSADLGDAVAESTHRQPWVVNANGAIRTRDIGGLRSVIDLGSNGPGQEPPQLGALDPAKMSDSLVDYPDTLRRQYLRDAFISSVAEGEDEGSQRSALTLAFRMWPLTSKAGAIRTYWDAGLRRVNKSIARILARKRIAGITPKHLINVNFYNEWSPMIPRDAEQVTDETVLLLQANGVTPKQANRRLGVVDDVNQADKELREWLEYKSSLQMAVDTNKAASKGDVGKPPPQATSGLSEKSSD